MQTIPAFLIIVSLRVCVALGPTDGYYVTPILDRPGIYYERVAPLPLQHVDWRVTVFLDVIKFIDAFPPVISQLKRALEGCSEVSSVEECREMLRIDLFPERVARAKGLVRELGSMAENSALLQHNRQINIKSMRKRSVPLGFIGSLSKSLFGTMNEEDAEYLNRQIDRLFADQTNLTQLISQGVHLTRSKLQELHEEHLRELNNMQQLHLRIDGFSSDVNKLINETSVLKYHHNLENFSYRAELKLNRYMDICEKYLRVIAMARDGRYDSSVLSAGQLMDISQEIRSRVPEFEFPLSHEYLRGEQLSRIVRTDIVFHSGRIMIVVHIPLLERAAYNLYRMHAWPVPQAIGGQNGSAHVVPAAPYIVVAVDRRTYFLADSVYIQNCVRSEHRYICTMEAPLSEVAIGDTLSCEIAMLVRPSIDVYRRCNVRITSEHDAFWTHLPSQGGWLFSLTRKEELHVLCPGNIDTTTSLEGAGVLHLSSDCVGRTHTTSLTGVRVYESGEQYFYEPEISLNISLIAPSVTWAAEKLSSDEGSEDRLVTVMKSGKTTDVDSSLFDVEQRLAELGNHRREKREQRTLFITGFSLHLFLGFILLGILWRAKAWAIIARAGNLCAGRARPDRGAPAVSVEAGQPKQPIRPGRETRNVRTDSSALETVEVGNKPLCATVSSQGELPETIASRPLPPQDPEVY